MGAGPAFFADVMLGRLARWLRILGYDTRYDRDIDDADLVRACEGENRILLTRDRAMLERVTSARLIFMESEKPLEQVRQLAREYGVALHPEQLFSRCTWCNGPLETLNSESVAGHIPPYVRATNATLRHCPSCDKLYWRGTHHDRFLGQIAASMKER